MPRGTTAARSATARTMAKATAPGKVIGEYQQISGNVRWQIDDSGMVSLLYQPFNFGSFTDWHPVPLDPVVQFAVHSLLQDCGKLEGLTTISNTNGAQPTITPQQRASQAAAAARRQRAQNKLVNQSS